MHFQSLSNRQVHTRASLGCKAREIPPILKTSLSKMVELTKRKVQLMEKAQCLIFKLGGDFLHFSPATICKNYKLFAGSFTLNMTETLNKFEFENSLLKFEIETASAGLLK